MKKSLPLAKANIALARQRWGPLPKSLLAQLAEFTRKFRVSVAAGDLLCLSGNWYVTHPGLLAVAQRKRCSGIHVRVVRECSDPSQSRWTVKAIVYKSQTCRGFVGYGDATPFNVSPQVRGAEMRVAETRAVNRALRKAYGIGICSVEELGSFSGPLSPSGQMRKPAAKAEPANGNGHHPLRDRLCLLIRQHQLDPALVKGYAADYCDVSELRQASQLSHYLACPRKYRYRYLDGWQEKETRAGLLFGRAFEQALAAYFLRQDAIEVLFKEWSQYQTATLDYSHGDNWDRMLQQGTKLLELFAQEDRVEIRYPKRNLQIKVSRALSATSQFVGYIDAFGYVDGTRCVIDWKTTAARYPDQPEGLLALDPQLACYSWLTGESEVAFVVFVRKRLPEIQYLRSTITDEQRREFRQLVEDTVAQIEAAQFLAHPGIRFPQNGCTSCPYLGLCLQNQPLIDTKLLRRPGGDLGWLDELEF